MRPMLLQIDHHSGQPIFRQVIDQIRRQVMAGQFAKGSSFRRCGTLRCSFASIR